MIHRKYVPKSYTMIERPNLSYIKEIAGGNKEFEKKFLSIVQVEFPRERASYNDLILNEEYEEASKVVHKIKHKLGILSLNEGYQVAIAYETELKSGNLELRSIFEEILGVAEDFIQKLHIHEGDHR